MTNNNDNITIRDIKENIFYVHNFCEKVKDNNSREKK